MGRIVRRSPRLGAARLGNARLPQLDDSIWQRILGCALAQEPKLWLQLALASRRFHELARRALVAYGGRLMVLADSRSGAVFKERLGFLGAGLTRCLNCQRSLPQARPFLQPTSYPIRVFEHRKFALCQRCLYRPRRARDSQLSLFRVCSPQLLARAIGRLSADFQAVPGVTRGGLVRQSSGDVGAQLVGLLRRPGEHKALLAPLHTERRLSALNRNRRALKRKVLELLQATDENALACLCAHSGDNAHRWHVFVLPVMRRLGLLDSEAARRWLAQFDAGGKRPITTPDAFDALPAATRQFLLDCGPAPSVENKPRV